MRYSSPTYQNFSFENTRLFPWDFYYVYVVFFHTFSRSKSVKSRREKWITLLRVAWSNNVFNRCKFCKIIPINQLDLNIHPLEASIIVRFSTRKLIFLVKTRFFFRNVKKTIFQASIYPFIALITFKIIIFLSKISLYRRFGLILNEKIQFDWFIFLFENRS